MAIDLKAIRKLLDGCDSPRVGAYESSASSDHIDPDIFYNKALEEGFLNGYQAALCVVKAKATKKDADKIQRLIIKAINEREDLSKRHQEEKERPFKGFFLFPDKPFGIRFI